MRWIYVINIRLWSFKILGPLYLGNIYIYIYTKGSHLSNTIKLDLESYGQCQYIISGKIKIDIE